MEHSFKKGVTVQVVGLYQFGGPEVLELIDRPDPHAGPDEVRIRVRAATVNPVDTLIRSGRAAGAFAARTPPYVPGLEAAGVLDEVGAAAMSRLALGQSVMAMVNPTRPAGGAYAQYVVLPASWVVAAPAGVSFAEAATVPMNGLTARRALDQLALPTGQWIAVSGAAGAVGGYVVQLAKADGLLVVADASERDRDVVRHLGADLIVERSPDFGRRVREQLPAGAAGLVDAAAIGMRAVSAVADGGLLAVVRGADDPQSMLAAARAGRITVHQTFVHDYDGDQMALDRLRKQVESGALTPRVARTYPPESASAAHRVLERGGTRGRLILTF
jgi:NADPH:quinone reductase-like Zn-dependent oxidoreductase